MSDARVKPEPADTEQPSLAGLAEVAASARSAAASLAAAGTGNGKDRAGSPSRGANTGESQRHGYAELLTERDGLHKKLEEQKKTAAADLAAEQVTTSRIRTERDDWHTKHDALERKVSATGITNFSDAEQVKRFKAMMRAVDRAGGVDAVLATIAREDKFRKTQYQLLINMQGWESGQIGVTEWKITDGRGQPKGMFSFTMIVPDPPEFSPTQLRVMCLMKDTAGPHAGQHPEHSLPMTAVNFTPLRPSQLGAALDKVMADDNVKLLFDNAVQRKAVGRGLTLNNFRNRLWEDSKREIWTKWIFKSGELTAYQAAKMSATWGAGLGQIASASGAGASSAPAPAPAPASGSGAARKRPRS